MHGTKSKRNDCNNERLIIVQTTAPIIREDIQSKINGSTNYPPNKDFSMMPIGIFLKLLLFFGECTPNGEKPAEQCSFAKQKSLQ